MFGGTVPIAALAFTLGCRAHRDRRVLVLGISVLAGLTASFTVLHDVLGETGERLALLASAGLLIAAHLRNFRLCRSGSCDHADH